VSALWRLRALLLAVFGVGIEMTFVLAGMGPRLVLVGAVIVVIAATVCLALDLGDAVVVPNWPSTSRPIGGTDRVEWRVGTIRILLMNERRSTGANDRLHDLLIGLVDDRLLAEHRIDREVDPSSAALVIGPQLHEFVTARRPMRELSDPRAVARIVTLIENL
jgi:hypothetical protein